MEQKQNISLLNYNTFGIDVNAKMFIELSNDDDVRQFIQFLPQLKHPVLVLGGGSNILFSKNFEGTVIKVSTKGMQLVKETEQHVYVKVQAGEVWDDFVMYCVDKNWGGVENLIAIPGTVGASPVQNIGAYGTEIKDVFYELEALNLYTGEVCKYKLNECNFGYRESIFKHELKSKILILSVTYKLTKNPQPNISYGAIIEELTKNNITYPTIKQVAETIYKIRSLKLPDWKQIGNGGSFFKNPVVTIDKYQELKAQYPTLSAFAFGNQMKLAAGWLIEQCGWKGKTISNAGVYEKQALVLVNRGGASGTDVLNLASAIQKSVKEKFDVNLEIEINVI